jgi:CheY-like chemotaxis protein
MRVLLVDDNDDFLHLMQELLKAHGYSPLLATDGKQAREMLEDEHVDAIISDVFMPTLDGVRFHSYVRDFLGKSDIPFIFMSGYDDPYTQEALHDSSADFFVSKTAPLAEVLDVLEKFRTPNHA